MRKVLLIFLASVLLVAPLSGQDTWSSVVKKSNNAVFYIEVSRGDEKGGCTGFVINAKEKLAMTANHCDPGEGGEMWADKVRAEVVAKDAKKDLLVIQMKYMDPERTALSLADKNPTVGQDVMSVGFGYALDNIQFRKASVSSAGIMLPGNDNPGPFIGTNISFTPGQSGGPVLDSEGHVVAIVQLGDGGTLGMGVGAETIRERFARFFQK